MSRIAPPVKGSLSCPAVDFGRSVDLFLCGKRGSLSTVIGRVGGDEKRPQLFFVLPVCPSHGGHIPSRPASRRSKMQRDKGKRGEREVVAFAEGVGVKAKRTWQTASGDDAQRRFCDIEIEGQPYQVKFYADGFATVYAALQGVKGAFIRRNQDKWLAVVPAEDYLRLLAAAKQTKEGK